jgi:hypothetical protein
VAYVLWVVAVGAGVFETVLAVGRLLARGHGAGPAIAAGLAIRLPVFAAGPVDLLFGASRTVHVGCVLGAVVLMFLPAANAWFRAQRRAR